VRATYELSEYPHPFILEPPLMIKPEYKPGERLTFDLILIGKAIDYLPHFVFVYQELGKEGIGKERRKYILRKVDSMVDGPLTIFDSRSERFIADFHVRTFADLTNSTNEQKPQKVLSLRFLTPTRIKKEGRFTKEIDFLIIMRNLLRRIILLSELHCGVKPNLGCSRLLKEAEGVKVVSSHLRWQDWERYSSRQHTKMKLGGFVGQITFKGELKEFMPLLKLGEYIHIGKGTSFGLGKYEIAGEE